MGRKVSWENETAVQLSLGRRKSSKGAGKTLPVTTVTTRGQELAIQRTLKVPGSGGGGGLQARNVQQRPVTFVSLVCN